jgi:hypothetical protein
LTSDKAQGWFEKAQDLIGKGTEIYNTAKGAIEDGKAKVGGLAAEVEELPKQAETAVKKNVEKVEAGVKQKVDEAKAELKDD